MKYLKWIAATLLPAVVIYVAHASSPHLFRHQYDDSYITYRYAINLAQGHGLVFNIGEHTDSASSFLYTLVLAASWGIGLKDLELVGGILGLISLTAICAGVYKLAHYLSRSEPLSIMVTLACGFNGFLSGWALSGMETIPWAALIVWAIYAMVVGAPMVTIAILVASASFTRLEGIFLLLPWLLLLRQERAHFHSYLPALLILASLVAFYIAKHQYYGAWISHAFQMKEIASYYHANPSELINHWERFALVPFALGLFGIWRRADLPILSYIFLSFLSLMAGPKSDWSRYSVHLLPIFYAYCTPAIQNLASMSARKWQHAISIAVFFLLTAQSWAGWNYNWKNMNALGTHQACRTALGRHIASEIAESEYIASSDLGAISYQAINHRFVDLIALTSSDVLSQYSQGKPPDAILHAKKVRWIADTFIEHDKDRIETLLEQFPKVRNHSAFWVDEKNPIFQCSADKRLHFTLTELKSK